MRPGCEIACHVILEVNKARTRIDEKVRPCATPRPANHTRHHDGAVASAVGVVRRAGRAARRTDELGRANAQLRVGLHLRAHATLQQKIALGAVELALTGGRAPGQRNEVA